MLGCRSPYLPAARKACVGREPLGKQPTAFLMLSGNTHFCKSSVNAGFLRKLMWIAPSCYRTSLFQFLGFVCAAMASSLESEAAFVDRASWKSGSWIGSKQCNWPHSEILRLRWHIRPSLRMTRCSRSSWRICCRQNPMPASLQL